MIIASDCLIKIRMLLEPRFRRHIDRYLPYMLQYTLYILVTPFLETVFKSAMRPYQGSTRGMHELATEWEELIVSNIQTRHKYLGSA